ncbi:MAG: 1-acyl-sn-glycerol-3-phosphate acyltransferase [Gammaproteobacteria bacterium]|nr:1-acyl-sn-glycerol-3-phosphate acyltransferase [Gammaproteobacteria bacterium]MBK9467910.1 1-acyl-sn-glycerol-3-phosphate acyltransferase [Gammaproteobacteria bacterium]MBP6481608.1 1-acyl-sn-glycerol-3-phosphate acyltransferase [Pseudomonadales bacterium]MBP7911015.1 1-acyl-sn-glycerol-3-phosphate acyltransferase [Pseudomonadales bacterium]
MVHNNSEPPSTEQTAPEGTRYDTQQVGPFKKGPFRMAMSAHVPVLPIVFRNAEMVAARDAATLCPGKVAHVVEVETPFALSAFRH